MMLGQQEQILALRGPDEAPADQRSLGEIEGRIGLVAAQALKHLLARRFGPQIMYEQRQALTGRQQLDARLSIDNTKNAAQGFVARKQLVQTAGARR